LERLSEKALANWRKPFFQVAGASLSGGRKKRWKHETLKKERVMEKGEGDDAVEGLVHSEKGKKITRRGRFIYRGFGTANQRGGGKERLQPKSKRKN